MNKPLIVTPQSLLAKSYDRFLEIIPHLNSESASFKVFFFKNFREFAGFIHAEDHYDALIRALKLHNIAYSEMPVFGFDEFFYLLKSEKFKQTIGYNGEIYCAPTNASYYISVSAGMIGYTGELKFVYNFNAYTGKIFFKRSEYNALYKNPRWSFAGVDKTKIEYADIADYSECHYTINGKTYYEVPLTREECTDKGTQAYTYKSKKSGYRLKFWSFPKTYEAFQIDKIKRMIADPSPEGMAVPKGLIYSRDNIPIGIAMENFNGVEVPFDYYYQLLRSPLRFMQSLIKMVAVAEAYSYIHRDFYHNILFDYEDYQAYIIDLDSVQYANYPPTAEAAENRSGLPSKYTIQGIYYSTVELSYWVAIMCISAVMDINPRKNASIVERNGRLNAKRYEELKGKAPHIAEMALWQYDYCYPWHPLRWLEAVKRDNAKKEFKSVFSDIKEYVTDTAPLETRGNSFNCDENDRGDMRCDAILDHLKKAYIDSEAKGGGTKVYRTISSDPNTAPRDTVKRDIPKHASGSVRPPANPVPIVASRSKAPKKDSQKKRKSGNALFKLYKMLVVKLFCRSLGTAIVSMDSSLPEEDQYDKKYKIFIAKGLWKKPLIASIVIIVISIVLAVAAYYI